MSKENFFILNKNYCSQIVNFLLWWIEWRCKQTNKRRKSFMTKLPLWCWKFKCYSVELTVKKIHKRIMWINYALTQSIFCHFIIFEQNSSQRKVLFEMVDGSFIFPHNVICFEQVDSYQLCEFWKLSLCPYWGASHFGCIYVFRKQFILDTALNGLINI